MKKLLMMIFMIGLLVGCSTHAVTGTGSVSENQTSLQPKKQIPEDFIAREINIASIGDSLTEGIGDESKQGGYTKFLKEGLLEQKDIKSITLNNYGVKGHKTTDLLNRLDNEEVQEGLKAADIIIITIGGNDIMKIVKDNLFDLTLQVFQEEQAKYETRLHRVLEKIRQVNSEGEIVLVGLYNPFGWFLDLSLELNTIIENWNEGSQRVLSDFSNTKFVMVDDIFIGTEQNLLASDEFHPNTKGYELISERILEAIMNEE